LSVFLVSLLLGEVIAKLDLVFALLCVVGFRSEPLVM